MAEVLKGNVYGPTGVRYPAGHAVPTAEPDWFISDLRAAGQIIEATPAPAKKTAKTTAPRKKTPARKASH